MQDTLDIIRKSSEMTTDIKRLAQQIERKERLTKSQFKKVRKSIDRDNEMLLDDQDGSILNEYSDTDEECGLKNALSFQKLRQMTEKAILQNHKEQQKRIRQRHSAFVQDTLTKKSML